jgi:peptidoglycan/xylan/chitin deacetylase (PgdA/CDA1 family)
MYVPGAAHYPRILFYHEISARFHLGINNVSPKRFLSHLDYLKNSKLAITELRGLAETSPPHSFCLTFDDGYLSFYDEVFPILIEKNIPVTLFVITGYVGRTNDWDVTFGLNRRRHLDWGKLREISEAGINVGSHGRTHRDMTLLEASRRKAELRESKAELEDHLGREITSLALPFGAGSVDVIMTARECGYREICGGIPNLLKGPLPGILPRMPVYRGDTARSLQRKLEMSLFEVARLALIQSCSKGTRILKR